MRSRDSYVASAQARTASATRLAATGFAYDVYISAAMPDALLASHLAAELQSHGLRVMMEPTSPLSAASSEAALQSAQHFLLVMGEHVSTIQVHEVTEFLKSSLLEGDVERRVLPVHISRTEPTSIPPLLRNVIWIKAFPPDPRDIAFRVTQALGIRSGPLARAAEHQIDRGPEISAGYKVVYADKPESYGPWVTTRGHHVLELPDRYHLAISPVTNQSFAEFVDQDGYADDAFWPEIDFSARRRFTAQDGRHLAPATWPSNQYPDGLGDHPVSGVCYVEALAFVLWLNHVRVDHGCRWVMPTEDMWEFAARGREGYAYPWGNQFMAGHCNSAEARVGGTVPISAFVAGSGPFGHLHLAGNVWEFVAANDQPEWACVLRGGSFVNDRNQVKTSLRLFSVPREHRAHDFGIRVAQVRAV